jgi:hypothetical protein
METSLAVVTFTLVLAATVVHAAVNLALPAAIPVATPELPAASFVVRAERMKLLACSDRN